MDYTALSLHELFKLGNVNVHNVGPDLLIIDFISQIDNKKYRGEGSYLLAAIANLKPVGSERLEQS